MKTIKQYLGKVSITCNGLWDINREYDRLCLVHDGHFASYISRVAVSVGTPLENRDYWQPVASLKDDIKIHTEAFEKNVLQLIADIQLKLKSARITVQNIEERDALMWDEVGVGCEVYVIDTQQSWILDSIVCSDTPEASYKEWHLEADGKIDSEEKYELEGNFDSLTADRAICDALGNIIHDTYITRETIKNYTESIINDFIKNWKYEIGDGTITYDMLSDALKQLLKNGGGTITNFPDEEDLTVKDNQLKFKDREYQEESFNGMGYVILRKNMMDSINLLEQSMINKPNTIYEIRYDYCLQGATITIPENCILKFNGGSFNNGEIILNENSKIEGNNNNLINIVICINGNNIVIDNINIINAKIEKDNNLSTIYTTTSKTFSNLYIRNSNIESTIGNAITLSNGLNLNTNNIHIVNNEIKFIRIGIEVLDYTESNRFIFTNIYIDNNRVICTGSDGDYQNPIRINGYSRYSYIFNNYFYGEYNEIIGADCIYFENNTIETITDLNCGFWSQWGADKILQTSINIKNNNFINCYIYINCAENVIIMNNIINEKVVIISCKQLRIINNIIRYSNDTAIHLINCINSIILNNTIYNFEFNDNDSLERHHYFTIETRTNTDNEAYDETNHIFINNNYIYDSFNIIDNQYDNYYGINILKATLENNNIYIGKLYDILNKKVYKYSIDNLISKSIDTTQNRPSNPSIGCLYFDITLKKPIWYNGTNWIDATGATV